MTPSDLFDVTGFGVIVTGGASGLGLAYGEALASHGARVTLILRGPDIHRHVKYWIKPDIENRIKNGEIKAYFNTIGEAHTGASNVLLSAHTIGDVSAGFGMVYLVGDATGASVNATQAVTCTAGSSPK